MLQISISDSSYMGKVIEKKVCRGGIVPIIPLYQKEDIRLVASDDIARRIAEIHLGNVPYCKQGPTSYRGEMAEFIYNNLRGKTL